MKNEVVNNSMNKKVQGLLGVASKMAMFNAAFDGYPKEMGDGTIFASDKAFKFAMKKKWEEEGKKVLYIKSMCIKEVTEQIDDNDKKKGKITRKKRVPRNLTERYEYLYDMEPGSLERYKDVEPILRNLYKATDVIQFGATFAVAKLNTGITGAVQFGQGMNLYKESSEDVQDILSPFRADKETVDKEGNTEKKTKENSTIGTKILSDEAHYMYPFTINPLAYMNDVKDGFTEGYTEEDYAEFKRTALSAVTAYNSNSKKGCENEFGLFIEIDEDTILPDFISPYISFKKGSEEEKNIIELKIADYLKKVGDHIQKIEVYYNPFTTKVDGIPDGAEVYDIRTMQRI